MLLRAKDRRKDQTYYLSGINERGLACALFPIGHLEKREVRALAQEWGLPTAERAESMGICFVGEKRRFNDFIGREATASIALIAHGDSAQYIPPRPGDIIDLDTRKRVGTHQGLWTYTIGQGARVPGMPEKTYVASKNVNRNLVFVVRGACVSHDHGKSKTKTEIILRT
jgi:tRNA-5-taurinomethyluridine 2-sulfurtransferase